MTSSERTTWSDNYVFQRALQIFRGEVEQPELNDDSDDVDFVCPATEEPNDYPLTWTQLAIAGRLGGLPSGFEEVVLRKSFLADLCGYLMRNERPPDVRDAIAWFGTASASTRTSANASAIALVGFEEYGTMPNFCDLPLPRYLAFDAVVNQLVHPLHCVTARVRRWSYQARLTQMYLDAIPFDECRYLYDWLPTMDLSGTAVNNLPHQLCYRFAPMDLGNSFTTITTTAASVEPPLFPFG